MSGGSGPYSFSFAYGEVPPGLSLSSSGLVSGTPTQQAGQPVNSRFYVNVTDEGSGQSVGNTEVAMAVDPTGYQAPPPVSMSPSSIPEATIGKPYSLTFQAQGGTPPYTWSILGNLPNGFTFSNGTISGESSEPEQSTFIVNVADSGEVESLNQYQFIDQQQGSGGKYTLTVSTGISAIDPTIINVLETLQSAPGTLSGLVTELEGQIDGAIGLLQGVTSVPQPECLEAVLSTLLDGTPPDPDCE